MPSKMTAKFVGKTCNRCGIGRYIEFPDGNEWNVTCNECQAILFCYEPLPHQQDFHKDGAKYRLYAGGYG